MTEQHPTAALFMKAREVVRDTREHARQYIEAANVIDQLITENVKTQAALDRAVEDAQKVRAEMAAHPIRINGRDIRQWHDAARSAERDARVATTLREAAEARAIMAEGRLAKMRELVVG